MTRQGEHAGTWAVGARLAPGRLTLTGALGSAHAHAHAAVQVLLVTSGQAVLTDGRGRSRRVRAAVIPAGAVHALDTGDARGAMVYLDPADRRARALTARLDRHAAAAEPSGGQAVLWQAAADPALTALDAAPDLDTRTGERALTALAAWPDAPPPPPSGALGRALALLPELIAAGRPVRLDTVAAQVGLSGSRLRHLFTEQLGLPFTACVRWARLQAAMAVVRDGGTLTAAAHAAAFTDSAHLTRVFHAMFGLAPSQAARHLHWH
ncbi:helix-turn-helix transcriptional regulator [Actinocorallia populi]|uniref:helix-turn-helix transcriptional regulator n=1 Tax=Actinocorallia populi TaxID=2079200 RepID=UPI000D08A5A1|nr:AraC family transcriptional regulator [Actinocorallia populi]